MTPESPAWLERLRFLLYADPDEHAWAELCAWAEHPPPDLASDLWIDYACGVLDDAWPEHLRTLPPRWREAPPPAAALVRRWRGRFSMALARSPHLRRLRVLNLNHHPVGDHGAAALAAGDACLTGLHTLRLRECGLETHAVRALASAHAWTHLRWVELSNNPLGPGAGEALAMAPWLLGLRELDLEYCDLGNAGVAAFAARAELPSIERLNLGENALGPRGVAALTPAPWLRRVERLRLGMNALGDDGARALANAPLDALRELDLREIWIEAPGAQALANAPWLPNLRRLDLYFNKIGPRGARALASAPLHHLEELVLWECNLDADAARDLAQSEALRHGHLKRLNLSANPLTERGAADLASAPWLPRLEHLTVQRCGLSPDAIQRLRDATPSLDAADTESTS